MKYIIGLFVIVTFAAVACKLQEFTQASVHYSEATGMAHLITENASRLKKRSPYSSVEEGLAAFLAEHPEVGIKDPKTELVEIDRRKDSHIKDWTLIMYRQIHKGIEVHDIIFKIVVNSNNQVLSSSSNIVPDLEFLDVVPKLSSETAIKLAITAVPEEMRTNDVRSELMIYRTDLTLGRPGKNCLIYYVTFTHISGLKQFVIVDAHHGQVLSSHNSVHHNVLTREIISNETVVFLERVSNYSEIVPGSFVDLMMLLNAQMYRGMAHVAGIIGWDNAGSSKFTSIFEIGANFFPGSTCPNAYWLPGRNVTAYCPEYRLDYDTFGHEWAHAYVQTLVNNGKGFSRPGGLSDSLNEFYADVIGEVFQITASTTWDYPIRTSRSCNLTNPRDRRWIVGDLAFIRYRNTAGVGAGARDMWNPNCYQNPATMNDPFFICNFTIEPATHNNVGVPSQVFALAVDGGEFLGTNYTGLGLLKTFHIYMRALPRHVSTSTFMQHAAVVNTACNELAQNNINLVDLNGNPSGLIVTANDCSTLAALFTATGMDQPACNQQAASVRFKDTTETDPLRTPSIISGPYPKLVMNVGQDSVYWHVENFLDIYCRIEGFDVYAGDLDDGEHSEHVYCNIPPIDGTGSIQISISEDGSTWFGPYELTVHEPYSVTAYGPTVGPVEGGSTIRIEGEGFFGDATGCNPTQGEDEDCPVCYFGYGGYGATVPATIESSTIARCTAPSWEGLSLSNRTVEVWLSMNYFIAVGPLPYEYKDGVGPVGDVPLTQSTLSFPPNSAPVASIKVAPPKSVSSASTNQIALLAIIALAAMI